MTICSLTTGDNFYVIMSGECEVIVTPKAGGVGIVVATIEAGGSFGELALMYNCPRAASVVCASRCKLWALERSSFERQLRKFSAERADMSRHLNPQTGYMLLQVFENLTKSFLFVFSDRSLVCDGGYVLQFAIEANLSCRLKPGESSHGCCLCTSASDPKPYLDCDLKVSLSIPQSRSSRSTETLKPPSMCQSVLFLSTDEKEILIAKR